jgi:rifampicin phosphotransferase
MPIWLDEIGDADRLRVGGKAFVLARLRRSGLPVPDGFVLTADEVIDGDGEAALRAAAERLGGPAAVRSSAALEDTAEASFAGQYLTLLDVSAAGLGRSVQTVRGSAPAAAGYARALRIDGGPPPSSLPVLVQRFVEPRAAGVVFTRHPADPGSVLVESHAGRGEAVVSGAVRPDRYVLDRQTGMLRAGAEGASLAEGELRDVFHLARRVEALLGGPQDVEWAVGPDGLVLLQSRPITVDSAPPLDPRLRRLTRANVGEVMPDPVTPLTATTLVAFLERAFRDVARRAGLLPRDAAPFLVLHRERIYLNLSLCLEIGRGLPGFEGTDMERLILGAGGGGGTRARVRPGAWPRLLGVVARLRRIARQLPAEIEAAREAVQGLPSRAAVATAGPAELIDLLDGLDRAGQVVAPAHVATSGACGVRLALLSRILAAFVPGEAAPRVNRLVTGLPGLESAAPVEALESLAGEMRRQPDWIAWLARPPAEAAAALRRGEAPAELRARLEEFLRRWGHRGVSEAELRAPSWEDDPAPVLAALRARAAASRPPGFRARAAEQLGRADEASLVSRLGPVRALLLRRAVAGARAWVARREATKSLAIALVDHGREVARAAGRRLVGVGALAQEDDVFFLSAEGARGGPARAPRRGPRGR